MFLFYLFAQNDAFLHLNSGFFCLLTVDQRFGLIAEPCRQRIETLNLEESLKTWT